MNSHLTSEELCNWLAGKRGQEVDLHILDCPACRSELNQLQNALAGFRASLERLPVPAVSRIYARQTLPRWILAAAAMSLVVATPVYWNVRQERAAEQARADELLLQHIEAGLSRSVPASMEPLMQLVSKENQ